MIYGSLGKHKVIVTPVRGERIRNISFNSAYNHLTTPIFQLSERVESASGLMPITPAHDDHLYETSSVSRILRPQSLSGPTATTSLKTPSPTLSQGHQHHSIIFKLKQVEYRNNIWDSNRGDSLTLRLRFGTSIFDVFNHGGDLKVVETALVIDANLVRELIYVATKDVLNISLASKVGGRSSSLTLKFDTESDTDAFAAFLFKANDNININANTR